MNPNPLPDSHVLLNIVLVGDETLSEGNVQPALVRKELTVARLIEEVMREFAKEKELDRNSQYSMSVEGSGGRNALAPDITVADAGLNDGARLVMTYKQGLMTGLQVKAEFEATQKKLSLEALITATNGALTPKREKIFKLTRFPAIIGRRPLDNNYTSHDVDLTDLEDDGDRRISRAQARLTESDGRLYIESLRPNNPVRIRDTTIHQGQRHPLNSGDIINLRGVLLRIDYHRM